MRFSAAVDHPCACVPSGDIYTRVGCSEPHLRCSSTVRPPLSVEVSLSEMAGRPCRWEADFIARYGSSTIAG